MTDLQRRRKHFFQHGNCIYCGKPAEWMCGAVLWRGGVVLPTKDEQENCPALVADYLEVRK